MHDPTEFRRGWHLLFAVLSLCSLAVVSRQGLPGIIPLLGGSWPWDGADGLLFDLALLLPIAVLAWLAFVVFDTGAKVDVAGQRWWKIGWEPWLLCATIVTLYVISAHFASLDAVVKLWRRYYSPFDDEWLGTEWGFLIAATVCGALAEELVFRALLQRALEGYMSDRFAILAQAVIFHLVHVYVYELSTSGLHVITGIAYGMAFARTRSLLAPLLLHAGGNLIHAYVFIGMLD